MTRSTRESEKRIHEALPSHRMEYSHPMEAIVEAVRKPGYRYRWARREICGEADYDVEASINKGWVLVPIDRLPGGLNLDPLNRNPIAKQFICYKDVILMERPEEFSIREERALNEFNENKIRSLRGVSNDTGFSSTPVKTINSF